MRCCINFLKKLICILLILSLAGCWNRRELDTLAIVMATGVDKPKESGEVQLTAQIVKIGEIKTPTEKSGGSDKAYWNIHNTSSTVFDAVRGFTHESGRKLFFPHNQVLIFGRKLAEDGVQKYTDFFLRDPEPRLNMWVIISKGTAVEVLDVKSELEKIPASNIAHLVEIQSATSQTSIVKLKDFLTRLMSKTTAPIAPLIEVSGEGENKTIILSGTAVFKRDKLVGQLDRRETRGLLWVLGEVKSGIIEVECSDGDDKAGLEIIRADGKITPVIDEDKITIKVNIEEEGNLAEQACSQNLASPENIEKLKKEKAAVIKEEVMAAIIKARELNTDIFGFGDAIHQKYPKQWKDLEDRWDEVFPKIEVEITVETKLRLTGMTNRPAMPE